MGNLSETKNLKKPTIDKKELILDVAKKLFASKGYNATGLREVAKQAGVSLGNVYNYFKNKEDLFSHLMDPDRVIEPLLELKKYLNDEFPFNLDKIIKEIKTSVDNNFELYRLIFIDLTEFNGHHTDKILDKVLHKAIEEFNNRIDKKIFGKVIKKGDYNFYVKSFIITTISFLIISNILPSTHLSNKSADYIAKNLSNVILNGILI